MKNLKVILPVAGSGTRLRPHTFTTSKVLLMVAGKPILGHIMETVQHLPASEFIFITGHLGKQIETYIKNSFRIKAHFIEQKEQLGLGHAIYLAKDYIEPNDDILILLGDTILDINLNEVVKSKDSLVGVKEVNDPSRFGVVELVDKKVKGFIEKPDRFVSNLAIVGIYFIKEAGTLFEALEEIIRKDLRTRGEFQLTDGLQTLIEKGNKISAFPVEGWFDCGKPETLLATNKYLLKKYGKEQNIAGSLIIPPVFIGENVKIERSILGPYVSVGENCYISDSIIKNSIVNINATVKTSILINSIIGESALVNGGFESLNVGDFSQIVQNLVVGKKV
mgnify:CR=1 FL=1